MIDPHSAGASVPLGTGFFVSADGDVVTNHHVVEHCATPIVGHAGSIPLQATIRAIDPINDLALLSTGSDHQVFARLRTDLRPGESIAAFGYPLSSLLSSGGNLTLRNVTALTGLADDTRFLQISTPIQGGNSGGPLIDQYGNVVGVTSKLDAMVPPMLTGDIPQNVNFAIRAAIVETFLSAHGIEVGEGETTEQLSPPDLAEAAAAFAVAVRCQ